MLLSVYRVASTFSHHGVQHVNFGCSCFTGDVNSSLHGAASILRDVATGPSNVARRPGDVTSILHDVATGPSNVARRPGDVTSILHDVARRPGDATSIPHNAASISDDATCNPGDNAKIPWYR
ncbi:unnamed protein product [Rotaria magnacalcarata]|uniref:Uncharacterized protein n=1 Tax=Rotaria magnacalcarata TaxID=392030 RepID=A0A816U9K8_9BILA|nr:unnamed protein product [Rotaria magnacalcarata]CAF2106548.1 unnamed protein product [Rotaria magnacalcarata]CAF4071863.1 unnamed protein product [Rotaria magnacalcarata]CAF4091062.1 unnamed protein product [Rotaria magnacalcarata]